VIYSHISELPSDIGLYDISVMASVLLHLQNPFIAIKNMLKHTKETVVITDLLPDPGFGRIWSFFPISVKNFFMSKPFFLFLPSVNNEHQFAWRNISPQAIVSIAGLFGFEDCQVTYHKQLQNKRPVDFFTLVCNRTRPINNCHY